MGLLDNLNFSQPFRISSLLPSEAQLQAFKDKSDAAAVAQFSQDPNPIRRVPFNLLTALGVNPTIAKAAPTIADNAPFTGDISALADARTAFGQGDLATAGLLTAATILPGVPAGKVKSLLKADDTPKKGIQTILREKYPTADLDIFEMDRGIELSKISLPKDQRSQGLGSKIMDDLIAYADANNLKVATTPDTTFGGSSKKRLEEFYKNFGFKFNKNRNKDFDFKNSMIRQPEAASQSPNEGLLKKSDDTKPLLNVDDAPKEGIANVVPPTDTDSGIIAFHGSGADFDRFSLSKIGTGEGNQAFGYGLYFTESEDIAKFYKDAMREKSTTGITKTVSYKGKNIDINNIDTFEDSFAYANADISPEKTKEKLLKEKERLEKDIASNNEAIKRINSGESYPSLIGNETISASSFEKNNLYQQPRLDAVNNVLNNLSDLKVLDTAKTYKVALAPKPDELLDYDLPLGKQNKFIKERLSKVANEMTVDDAINLGFDPFDFGNNDKAAINAAKKEMLRDDQSVQAFLNNWQAFRGEQGAGEKLLNKHGIKGIKYLDNASRNTFGGKLLGINKLDDGQFQARIVLDDPNRQTGLGGSGRVITTSKPYKTQKEAEDWANKQMGNRQSNYVIFDENLINILAKYGIVGGVGITALQNSDI